MLKQLVNECIVTLWIIPEGPILIKSGVTTLSGPDMAFVRLWRNETQEVYLPGSSLKGILRSHAERIARTLNPDAACDPFAKSDEPASSCGQCFEKRKKDPDDEEIKPKEHPDTTNRAVYRDSCPICRLFGSAWYAGRLATADAYAVERPPKPQPRDGVGIDRFTGGAVPGVKFDLEVVTEGCFETTLHLRNFELWQLGLLSFLIQDLKESLLRVGAARSRGLGKVRGEVKEVKLHYLGRGNIPEPGNGKFPICGVGALTSAAESYGMKPPNQQVTTLPQGGLRVCNGLRTTYAFPGDTFPWEAVGETWVSYAADYRPSPAMTAIRSGPGG